MEYTTIRHEIEDGILTVVLDRSDHLNAFTVEMADELEHTFVSVNDNDEVRAVIVTGEGRAFCAGMDDLGDPGLRRIRDTGGRVTLAIHGCRKPVIAAINGAAVGIGATMTLAMDARLLSNRARFGLVFGKLGIVPDACSTWFLPRLVGMPAALDLVYRADILDADAAHAVGLAQAVYEPDALLGAARALADAWTRDRSPVSVALMRQMMLRNSAAPHPVEAHRVDSLAMFYTSIADGADGVRAFLDKRPPSFRGKASEMPPFYREWVDAPVP
ncbi:crotonase/enoyl-CoA hydratase family protein [Rhodococcus opacus]|uniref:crotonase/enoyl-CoA hydratase family protein n=1 Tax=Rhodococcus opacus TaxID=37919 RepID=UPI002949063B|nr:crotonase/enoyl-CoA hydratase family protein [Rhodococcus opacus]MDV6246833.1 crotonase/enoyl-CoA hydratase family protein [Rhodococcus opacus]